MLLAGVAVSTPGARRYDRAMEFGAHLKTAGGAHKAAERAGEIGADALQIFTQSPRMWRHPDIDPEAAERFRAARRASGVGTVTCHATYLINLGATDDAVYSKSVEALRRTMLAAQAYEADGVVFHLGSHLGRGLDAALHQVVPALQIALGEGSKRSRTRLVIENSAGAGNTMGLTLEDIARVIDELGRPKRIGVCLDTCHLWATGVDIRDRGRVEELVSELDERIGLDRLVCLHVNDAALPLGARRDVHADPGDGLIGPKLGVMLGHPRLQHAAQITESPGPGAEGPDKTTIAALRRLHRAGVRRHARA
jgi:deoxyribonuclease IV